MADAKRDQLHRQQGQRQHEEGCEYDYDAQGSDHGCDVKAEQRAGSGIKTLFLVGLDRNAVELQPVIDQPESVFTGNPLLQRLDLR